MESFNGRLRDECLNEHLFTNLKEARQIIEEWRIDYNTNRPHTSLNGLTPTEFATRPDQGQNWNRLYLETGASWGAGHRSCQRVRNFRRQQRRVMIASRKAEERKAAPIPRPLNRERLYEQQLTALPTC